MASSFWLWWLDSSNGSEKFVTALLTILVATIFICWLLWNAKESNKRNAPSPPGPRGLPLVGYLPFLGTHLHKDFTKLASVYGPIYKLWLGKKLCVVISSPSLVKEIVRNKDIIFANRDPTMAAQIVTFGGNDIAFCNYSDEWKQMRKIFVREMLSNANLDATSDLRKQGVKKSIRDVYDKIGKPIDLGELSFVTSINTVLSMLLGSMLEGEEGLCSGTEFRDLAAELMVLLGKPNISDLFPVLASLDLQGIQRQSKKVRQGFAKLLDYAIEKRTKADAKKSDIEKNKGKKDLLQILLELQDHKDKDVSISMTQLRGLLMDIVVGGSDTTAAMVEWVMAELMHNQEIMEKVYQELNEVVGLNGVVEEFHMPKLHYLDAVVKETFRLHPALPLLVPRKSRESCTVGGYSIPEGSTLFLNIYAIHRDPQLWTNPLQFEPERFLNEETRREFDYSGNNFQFLPFGSGRRICAGLPLAEKTLMFQLASWLHSFEWKLPEDTMLDSSEKSGIVAKKMKPLVAIATPRLSNLDLYCTT